MIWTGFKSTIFFCKESRRVQKEVWIKTDVYEINWDVQSLNQRKILHFNWRSAREGVLILKLCRPINLTHLIQIQLEPGPLRDLLPGALVRVLGLVVVSKEKVISVKDPDRPDPFHFRLPDPFQWNGFGSDSGLIKNQPKVREKFSPQIYKNGIKIFFVWID